MCCVSFMAACNQSPDMALAVLTELLLWEEYNTECMMITDENGGGFASLYRLGNSRNWKLRYLRGMSPKEDPLPLG